MAPTTNMRPVFFIQGHVSDIQRMWSASNLCFSVSRSKAKNNGMTDLDEKNWPTF